jgi:anti-sigma B factor antagonist
VDDQTPPFEISTASLDGDGLQIAVRGELDMATAGRLLEAVRGASEPGGRLLLDLSEVAFMDSTGLSALLDLREHAGSVALVAGRAVRRVVQLVDLGEDLPLYETVDEARERLLG